MLLKWILLEGMYSAWEIQGNLYKALASEDANL